MAFTPCSFLLLFRKYFFMTASVNGKLMKVISQVDVVTTSDAGTIFIYDIPKGTHLYSTCSDTNLWVRTYYTKNYLVLGVANYNNVNIANQEVTIETFWLVNV
nr:MAG TPA: hypothetical protein [Bacteriophage sp.]